MSEPVSPERLCENCQLPLSDAEMEFFTAHSERRCRELLRSEIDRLLVSEAALKQDTERLQAVLEGPWGIYVERDEKDCSLWFVVCDFGSNDLGRGKTPAEAIDAARKNKGD